MKAIQIRFLPPTNFKEARMKAFTEGGNELVMPFSYELSNDELRVEEVARELIYKMKWNVDISGIGSLPNGDWVATLREAA